MQVEIRELPNKGKGIFALKNYRKGEHILKITGKIIETEHPEDYPEEITEHWGPLGKEGKTYRFILPESPWMYMNHSCESNAGIIDDKDLIAKKTINKGDEITIDYSALDIESLTRGKKQLEMTCQCGSKHCRKKITTFDQLSKEQQEKLKPYLNKYMRKKYI